MLDPHVTLRNATSTASLFDLGTLIYLLREWHRRGSPWQSIADHFGVNKAVVYRIAKDNYEPKDPEIRRRLGLPVIGEVLVDFLPPGNVYLPGTTRIAECLACGRKFFRTSNAMKYCRKDCR